MYRGPVCEASLHVCWFAGVLQHLRTNKLQLVSVWVGLQPGLLHVSCSVVLLLCCWCVWSLLLVCVGSSCGNIMKCMSSLLLLVCVQPAVFMSRRALAAMS